MNKGLSFWVCFIFIFVQLSFSMPVGLEVNIYTNPSEINGPNDIYELMDAGGILDVTYFIEIENFGSDPAYPAELRIVLPTNCVIDYQRIPFIPEPFTFTGREDNIFTFRADSIPSMYSGGFGLNVSFDISCFPEPVIPPNCVTLQADAFLNSPQENESHSDNTTFCRVVADSDAPDLYVNKSILSDDCSDGSITYLIEYGNLGNRLVENATITDFLPLFTSFVSSNPPQTNSTSRTVSWDIPIVPSGSSNTIEITVATDTTVLPIEFINMVTITSDSAEVTLSNNSAVVSSFCANQNDSCYNLVTKILYTSQETYPESLYNFEVRISNIGLLDADNVGLSVEAEPSLAITSDNRWDMNVGTILSGDSRTYPFQISLRDGCQPISGITISALATPVDFDCDETDNSDVLDLTYDCLTDCPPAMLSTRIITPNGDGKNDEIVFSPSENVRVHIYDSRGIMVRKLDTSIVWDGKDDNGVKVEPGLYVYQMFCPASSLTPHYSGTIAVKR